MNKKIKRIELTDDSAHIAELLIRIKKSGEKFYVYRHGRFLKEYDPKSEEDWEIINKELASLYFI